MWILDEGQAPDSACGLGFAGKPTGELVAFARSGDLLWQFQTPCREEGEG